MDSGDHSTIVQHVSHAAIGLNRCDEILTIRGMTSFMRYRLFVLNVVSLNPNLHCGRETIVSESERSANNFSSSIAQFIGETHRYPVVLPALPISSRKQGGRIIET